MKEKGNLGWRDPPQLAVVVVVPALLHFPSVASCYVVLGRAIRAFCTG